MSSSGVIARVSSEREPPLVIHDGPTGLGFAPLRLGSPMPHMRTLSELYMPARSWRSIPHAASLLADVLTQESAGRHATSAATWRTVWAPALASSQSIP